MLTDDCLRSLDARLARIPAPVRARIRLGTCDLKAAYRKAFERWYPQIPVVADPFHLVKRRQHPGGRLWPLLTIQDRLSARPAATLQTLRTAYPALGALQALEDSRRDLQAQPTRRWRLSISHGGSECGVLRPCRRLRVGGDDSPWATHDPGPLGRPDPVDQWVCRRATHQNPVVKAGQFWLSQSRSLSTEDVPGISAPNGDPTVIDLEPLLSYSTKPPIQNHGMR